MSAIIILISKHQTLRFMLATNTPTVKEKTASGGKREWNCGGIYGMMGIGMSCVACGSYGIRQIAYKIAQGTWEIG